MSEREEVTKPLKKALEKLGFLVWRLPAGGQRGRIRLMPKGTPDLLVFQRPAAFATTWLAAAVETKLSHRPACKCDPCEAQRGVRADLERRGVHYVIARSVDEGLRALGVPF